MDKALKVRALIVCLVLVAGLSALSVRLLMLQSWDRKLSDRLSIHSFQLNKTLPASRGLVVDRNNEPLAQNRPLANLVIDGYHLKNYDTTSKAVVYHFARQAQDWNFIDEREKHRRLRAIRRDVLGPMEDEAVLREHRVLASEILGRELKIPPGEILEQVEKGRSYLVLQKNIREKDARRIEKILQEHFIQGFSFERFQKRRYPMPELAPHIVGFLNGEGEPQAGVEKSMDNYLRGRDGKRTLKRDRNGLVLLTESAEYQRPHLGKHVRLSLDIGIQSVAEEELNAVCEQYAPTNASIIVVDPYTGDLLAMASRPQYNLNLREIEKGEWTAYSWQGTYEAGSVMKIVGLSAVLDQRLVNRETEVHCGWGRIRRPHIRVNDHTAYGDLTFDQVLAKSSNTGTFAFAEMLGQRTFYQYLDAFGFGQRTGLDLPGEVKGQVSNRKIPQNFASATYGYGLSVSPLQIAMAYSAIANGGKLLKPRLIRSIISNKGVEVEVTPVHLVRRVMREETARQMRLALEQVVLKGTGRLATVAGYRSAGKTGTAWKVVDGKYNTERKALTFAGFLPVEEPRFVAVVIIDDPQQLGEDEKISGGRTAGPVFARLAPRVASRLNIAPTEPIEEEVQLTSTH